MSELITDSHASEEGHWYRPDGTPAYTIIGKNGEERPTTLRDARKEGLVPSVTTIISLMAKPGLENWKIDNAILAALTCPRIDDESETAYLSRIKKDAQEQARNAAERGTLIHSIVQEGFEYDSPTNDTRFFGSDDIYYLSARDTLSKACGKQNWICEKSFATHQFGGKCDLHNQSYLIDIKTTDKDLSTVKLWDDHALQLSAYQRGLHVSTATCGILFVNSISAESKVVFVLERDLERGWAMFSSLVDLWYAKTGL